MKTAVHLAVNACVALLALAVIGCMTWKPGWEQTPHPGSGSDVSGLLENAEALGRTADDRPSLKASIDAYEAALDIDPTNYQALTALGHQYILMGAAYCEERSEKIRLYRLAMQANERAMYTHPEFKKLADQGQRPWEACPVLGRNEINAMFQWVTALLYYFKEGMTWPEKVVNVRWIQHTGPMLERIETLDPAYGGGGVQFSLALYYGILPASLGGDENKSRFFLSESVRIGPDWLLNRWGRAKYFYFRDDNRQGFIDDLEWVVAQDLETAGGVYAWKVYFQRDARQLLANVDRYF